MRYTPLAKLLSVAEYRGADMSGQRFRHPLAKKKLTMHIGRRDEVAARQAMQREAEPRLGESNAYFFFTVSEHADSHDRRSCARSQEASKGASR